MSGTKARAVLIGVGVAMFAAVVHLMATAALARGTVLHERFESRALGLSKAYRVYLPDGYASGDRRYPVIYLLHGWGVTEDAWISPSLDLPDAADAMKLQAIVVMPDGDRSFYANATTPVDYESCLKEASPRRNKHEKREEFCVRSPRYEDYITTDLIRHIDDKFRTVARKEGRALTGESAGGAGAIHLAMRNAALFSSAASHSGGLALLYDGPHPYDKLELKLRADLATYPPGMQEPVEIFGTDVKGWRAHDPSSLAEGFKSGDVALYFDCGREDETGAHDQALFFHGRLNELGIMHHFESVPGKHDEALWKERIRYSLRFHVDQFLKAGVYFEP